MLDVLPDEVAAAIQKHLRVGCQRAVSGWESAQADEDTLTGDLGASLRTGWKRVSVRESANWHWRFNYAKFRGRGKGAEENLIGADGIFQIEIENRKTGELISKGVLFQAKKYNDRGKKRLTEQLESMEKLIPNGSALVEFGPEVYRGIASREVLGTGDGILFHSGAQNSLGDFLADEYLPCNAGVRGMYYEAARHTLLIPDSTEGFRRIRTELTHGFRIEVQHTR